ncbi:hypothetical protein HMPREF9628_01159 [Peptoanaerobacter stomatis]|uniref:Uncharacterized protein n=1 Tax=Peptoanaerobacter stomatis TaxID=796937 RepID=G9XAZ2_9FIRM|nr:hypothetical protein [Peptoanaerobacter stomatis]EHL19826.1 hypothetical protein HMPREF9628_01159 [Peptoanaerobacter stomatis]
MIVYLYIPKNRKSAVYDPTTIDIILNTSDGKGSGTQVTNYPSGNDFDSGSELYKLTFYNLHKDVDYSITFRGSAKNSMLPHIFESKVILYY